jgi:hypothetical protein
MKKVLFISFLLICIFQTKSNAQQDSAKTGITVHEYYVIIAGVNTKKDVKLLEKHIRTQEGVTSFSNKDFPVRFFILRSTRSISKKRMEQWVNKNSYRLQLITEDPKAKKKIDKMYFEAK